MSVGKCITKYVRVPPRKARLAADLIRGLPVQEAKAQLQHVQTKGGKLLIKTLDTAVADAELHWDLRKDRMVVLEVRVDEGPRLKRAKPRSKGSKVPVIKRTSHFTVVVGEEEQGA